MQATVKWSGQMQFAGTGNGGHSVVMDGDNKAGNSPMELVLIALCGCTAFDVVSILQKKREPFTAIEVSAEGDKAPIHRAYSLKLNCNTGLPETSRAKQ